MGAHTHYNSVLEPGSGRDNECRHEVTMALSAVGEKLVAGAAVDSNQLCAAGCGHGSQ